MKSFKVIDIIFLTLLTILFVYDYFPNTILENIIPKNIFSLLVIALVIFNLLFKSYRNFNNLEIFKYELFSIIYLILLIVFLTILGGKSTCGISFKNAFFWIALFISCFEMFFQFKKSKQLDK